MKAAAIILLLLRACDGFGVTRRALGVAACRSAPLIPLAAAAAPKKYSADDAKQAIAGIKAGRKASTASTRCSPRATSTAPPRAAPIGAEDQAAIIIQAPVLAAEDKKAIGTIRRYGVAADVIIMAGGLKEALRDEDARGAKSYLAKCAALDCQHRQGRRAAMNTRVIT
ncbi:hypothetical protein JL721_731 [Aureococcus anophagefferens]|nr:hypothetical protein JL721_731 [Aureococcus anophagefferens]